MVFARLCFAVTLFVQAVGMQIAGDAHAQQYPYKGRYGSLLAVPHMKFAFCFMPKVACTQFNRLVNALNNFSNNLGGACEGPRDPNWVSSVVNFGLDGEQIINDPSWTKAVFARDPLERAVSAYRSKCEPPRECAGGGPCRATFQDTMRGYVRSDNGYDQSAWSRDEHWRPQEKFCGGLSANLHKFDYVGHLTRDYSSISKQVAEMLQLVQRRQPEGYRGESTLAFEQAFQESFGEQSEQEACDFDLADDLKNAACKWFPGNGPSITDAHNHLTSDGVLASYYNTTGQLLFDLVQHYYKVDYDSFPKLTTPAWTNQLREPRRVPPYFAS